jgi:methylglyoxal synthase
MKNDKRPIIALVATPKFKQQHKAELRSFVYRHLYTLTCYFDVISTGVTHGKICSFLELPEVLRQWAEARELIAEDLKIVDPSKEIVDPKKDLEEWRDSIQRHFVKKMDGVEGMIEVANELVQGRLDAIIQFSVEDDTTVRAGSAVLRREANVHDVPIASDIPTANSFVAFWKRKLSAGTLASSLFRPREVVEPSPCAGLELSNAGRVLALIAHDKRKDEMCRFVVQYKDELLQFDHILTTGHSGALAQQYLRVAGWKEDYLKRILRCHSGPEGGDVEIAAAVIQGLCHNVIFFQDPGTSHPHEADIRLFEQAILAGTDVRLASNAQSARILLETIKAADADR